MGSGNIHPNIASERGGDGRIFGLSPTDREKLKLALRPETARTSPHALYGEATDATDVVGWASPSERDVDPAPGTAPSYNGSNGEIDFDSSRPEILDTTGTESVFTEPHETGSFTIALRMSFSTSTPDNDTILTNPGGGRGVYFGIDGGSGDLKFEVRDSTGSILYSPAGSPSGGFDTSPVDVLVEGDGSTVTLTWDGEQIGSASVSTEAGDANQPLRIGANRNGSAGLTGTVVGIVWDPRSGQGGAALNWIKGGDYA